MSEKGIVMAGDISESRWKAFTKKQKLAVELDDKELLKALARFDKTDERKPEPRLEALHELAKEIPKQVVALAKLKKSLGDKPFGLVKDELYALLEDAESLRKKTQALKDASEAEQDDDEDAAPSALLNPKLLFKQLNLCRKDPERRMHFAFVDAKGRDQPAALALHPRTGTRALFTKLQEATGVKTGAYGTAWVDGTSLMLQLDKPLSGLVKKVRAPVKASGFRIAKAVLCNLDGSVFEQDEQPDDAADDGTPEDGERGAPPAPPQPSATYEKKLADLLPRVAKAAADGSADAVKHQKLLDFAAEKAGRQDFLSATAALKQVEQLLDKPAPKLEAGNVEAGTAFKSRLTALIPKIKAAQEAGGPRALDVKLKASEAGVAAGKRDFDLGQALLDELESLLAPAAGTTASPQTEPVDASAAAGMPALQARLAALNPAYLRIMKLDPPERTRLSALMALAHEALEAGDAGKAASSLDSLSQLLDAAGVGARPAVRTVPESLAELANSPAQLVAYRQALLRWDAARKGARAQLDELKAAIGGRSPALAGPAAVLERVMDGLDTGLSTVIDDAINAADAASREALHEQAAALARSYLMTVNFNPLFATLDRNPVRPLTLRALLGDALKQVVAALPA